jgi:hypothetical protein
MDALVLACGGAAPAVLSDPSAWPGLTVTVARLPAHPEREVVDPLLDRAVAAGARLVVTGPDADLGAVVARVLRRELLGTLAVGLVPVAGDSAVARTWSLPDDPGRAAELAVRGEPEPVALIRDDAGGVLLGVGLVGPVRGVAYCDDVRVLRGQASRLRVTPDPQARPVSAADRAGPDSGLVVAVQRRLLLTTRSASFSGRALQLGCLPTRVIVDGVAHRRAVDKWTWYRHDTDLRLIRGVV